MSVPKPKVLYQHQLKKRRKPRKRLVARPPELSVPQILTWADVFHQRTGRWPNADSGPIPDTLGEKWSVVESG